MRLPYNEWLDFQLLKLRGALWARSHAPVRRIIFVHIPKCAGQSVTRFIKAHVGSQGSGRTCLIYDIAPDQCRQDKIDGARGARFVGGHFGWETLERVRRPGDFVFTILREPFQRLWSNCTYFDHYHRRREDASLSLAEFVTDPAYLVWSHNVMARQLAASFDTKSLSLPDDELRERAIRNLATFDYVGFLETFDSDFREIASECRLPAGRLPHLNATRSKPAAATMAASDEAVQRCLAADYALYSDALRMFRPPQVSQRSGA